MRGLSAVDFVLLRDGETESIAVFEEIETTPARAEPVTLPLRTAQNYGVASAHQDVVILFLDFLNGSWSTSARIRSYLGDVARQFAEAHIPVTVVLLSHRGLVQVHSFSSDLQNLTKAIEQWNSGAPITEGDFLSWSNPFTPTGTAQSQTTLREFAIPLGYLNARALDKAAMTLHSIEQLAEAYRGVPGRKKLIWMSTGFPMPQGDLFAAINPSSPASTQFHIDEKITRAWKSLSDANITVYPIDSNGVVNPSWENEYSAQHSGVKQFAPPVILEVPSNIPSLLEVAQKTGGQNCEVTPTECVGRILVDGTHYYLLGFYLRGVHRPGWHNLQVSVKRPRAKVRARDGFFVGLAPVQKLATDRDEVMTALASPLDYTSVPLRLHWSVLGELGNDTQVELVLTSPPGGVVVNPEDSRINVDYLAFIRPLGKTEGRTFPATLATKLSLAEQKSFAAGGFLFRKQVTLGRDRFEVRVLLRDNVAKKMGTVSTTLDLTATSAPK
jgi:VWFA-related protein